VVITIMAITLWNLFEATLLCLNAVCVLNEERFLAKCKLYFMLFRIAVFRSLEIRKVSRYWRYRANRLTQEPRSLSKCIAELYIWLPGCVSYYVASFERSLETLQNLQLAFWFLLNYSCSCIVHVGLTFITMH